MALGKAGDNIITTKHLFANTLSLFDKTLKPFQLSAKYTDLTDPQQVVSQIDSKTIAIFFETITNPQLEVADIAALSTIANAHNLLPRLSIISIERRAAPVPIHWNVIVSPGLIWIENAGD